MNICFLENTQIKILNDGTYDNSDDSVIKFIKVQDVKKNTQVITYNGIATVLCVIKLKYSGVICKLNETGITPFHPVFHQLTENIEWFFPNDSGFFTKEIVSDVYIYDFILDQHHTVKLFDIYAITLNHGKIYTKTDDYFGTNKFQNDLMKHHGWDNGSIELYEYNFIRDEETNTVIGINY